MSYLSKNYIMYRQVLALERIVKLPCSAIVRAAPGLKKVTAFFVMLFQLLGAMFFDYPTTPDGPMIDMGKFELVWADECNGASLDRDVWGGSWTWYLGGSKLYQSGEAWWDPDQITFDGANMRITTERRNGKMGEGVYNCCILTRPDYTVGGVGYEQKYGYFEIRCVLPKGDGLNAAFWLLGNGMFDNQPSGVGGSEIDVFETKTDLSGKEKHWKDSVYSTIHIGGYENSNHKNQTVGHFYVPNRTEQYNTYGVEWNENEYIFYINGQETGRTDFAGPCREKMYLLISVLVDANVKNNRDLPTDMVIDYVRAYQYK